MTRVPHGDKTRGWALRNLIGARTQPYDVETVLCRMSEQALLAQHDEQREA